MGSPNLLAEFFKGPVGPFSRVVIFLALIVSSVGSGRLMLHPLDTEDRWRGADARAAWEEHKRAHEKLEAKHEQEVAELEGRLTAMLTTLSASHHDHLQHSAEYTRVIEDDREELETLIEVYWKHIREDH